MADATQLLKTLWWKSSAPARRLRRGRPVRRTVQGVTLWMPGEHELPGYAVVFPDYGQNLVRVARALGEAGTEFTMVDVGANIGDSMLQVRAAVPGATVLGVEGDPYYLPFLHRNTAGDERLLVEPSLLLLDAQVGAELRATRSRGTTRFEVAEAGDSAGTVSVREFVDRYAGLPPVRLVKSDTDGFDTRLVPVLAREYAAHTPALFFEYDERLSRLAGDEDPAHVFEALAGLGYDRFVLWDNLGRPLEVVGPDDVARALADLRAAVESGSYAYWDVAAVHADDPAGARVVAGA